MIFLDVHLNGTKVCRAGVGKYGLVHVNAGWIVSPPGWGRRRRSPPGTLSVGGSRYLRPPIYETLLWHAGSLAPGDQVLVHCLEASTADEPTSRERSDKPSEEEQMEMLRSRLAGCALDLGRVKGTEAAAMRRDLRALLKKFSK